MMLWLGAWHEHLLGGSHYAYLFFPSGLGDRLGMSTAKKGTVEDLSCHKPLIIS